jgi:outer membrane lipoprotein-sorting protein
MKSRSKKNLLLISFLVVLFIFSSGCEEESSAEGVASNMQLNDKEVISGIQPNAEEIISNLQMKTGDLEDYSFTMYVNLSSKEQKPEIYEVAWKKPDLMNMTLLSPEKNAEVITVSDGNFQWVYNPEDKTVFKTEISDDFNGLKLFEPDVYAEFLNGIILNGKTASLLRTENIDGKSVYLLELTPSEKNESLERKSQRMSEAWSSRIWVDSENWMLLRYELYDSKGNVTLDMEIQNLKLNTEIPDSEFEFKIPDGAQVKLLGVEDFKVEPKKITLEEAKQLVDFEVLTPKDLPEGYEFNYSTVSSSKDTPYSAFLHSGFSIFAGKNYEKITIVYKRGDEEICIIEKIVENDYPNFPKTLDFESESEDVLINGKNGTISSIFGGNMKTLTWQNEELEITIISSLDKTELLNVAESVS